MKVKEAYPPQNDENLQKFVPFYTNVSLVESYIISLINRHPGVHSLLDGSCSPRISHKLNYALLYCCSVGNLDPPYVHHYGGFLQAFPARRANSRSSSCWWCWDAGAGVGAGGQHGVHSLLSSPSSPVLDLRMDKDMDTQGRLLCFRRDHFFLSFPPLPFLQISSPSLLILWVEISYLFLLTWLYQTSRFFCLFFFILIFLFFLSSSLPWYRVIGNQALSLTLQCAGDTDKYAYCFLWCDLKNWGNVCQLSEINPEI